MIYGYTPDHVNKVANFTKSLGGNMIDVDEGIPSDATGLVCTGFSRGLNEILKEGLSNSNLDMWHVDNSYFKKINRFTGTPTFHDRKGCFRITKNCWLPSKIIDRDSKRRPNFLNMRPWRGFKGEYILAIPTDPRLDYILGCPDWLPKELEKLDFDLPIVYRDRDDKTPLEFHFQNAAAVVSHSSMVLIEAMLYGITTFCSEHGHTYEFTGQHEEPDRWRVIDHLSYTVFSMEEIISGYAARTIEETYG